MSENNSASSGIDLAPTGALLASGSPKGMYVFFLLSLCKNYFEVMRVQHGDSDIDSATAALVAFCPNREKRMELWRLYTKQKNNSEGILTASVFTIGELISHLSEVLEFEEQSTGGLL